MVSNSEVKSIRELITTVLFIYVCAWIGSKISVFIFSILEWILRSLFRFFAWLGIEIVYGIEYAIWKIRCWLHKRAVQKQALQAAANNPGWPGEL